MGEYYSDKLSEAEERIPKMEYMLGIGLRQPFNNCESASRKLMSAVHQAHVFPLFGGEKAFIETGYENRFGDYSSSITATDSTYRVVAKISKYSFSPNHHYYLILEDLEKKKLDIVERIPYHYVTESYGFLYNNITLDNIEVNQVIPNNTILQKSLAFDEYNNRKDGLNFNVIYLSLDQNLEDSVIISQDAADKMISPLIKPTSIMINENNIPLNLYGDEKTYRCIPDIGEDIKDNILIALRKEKKEEMVFTESVERLRTVMMSDEKKLLSGKVIDIDIMCNNPENLDTYHNSQFKMYYNELQRMSQEIVTTITPYVMNNYEISYDLKKLYSTSKRVLNHDEYIDKRPFSNIIIEVTVLEENRLQEGDKISNRYGGKGVVSKILPTELMPTFGEDNERVDLIFNSFTMYNRVNPGQIFEISINHISHEIVKKIAKDKMSMDEAFGMIFKFLDIVIPEQRIALEESVKYMNSEEKRFYLESVVMDGCIQISMKPISDSFDIDRLKQLYDAFPFATHMNLKVPIKDSNGKYRMINARRKVIVGKEYIYRLKQFALEKFSATSLSATNVKGVNTKSKSAKNYNELYSNTPIRFGNMEINNFNHIGAEAVINNLMLHSVSPQGRKLVEQMYTCNPYEINIKLDMNSKNRVAEVVNTYLKAIGLRLVFAKIPKYRYKVPIAPFTSVSNPVIKPFEFAPAEVEDKFKWFEEIDKINEKKKKDKKCIQPFEFDIIDTRRRLKQIDINNKAIFNKTLTPRERYENYKKEQEEG